MKKVRTFLAVVLLALTACKTPAPHVATPSKPPAALQVAATRKVEGATVALDLTGKVKVVSNNGATVVSDQGGGIISDNSGGIISDNSGGIVSNNSGGYRLAAAPRQALLAGAPVQIMDAAGRMLVGADGKPLGGKTDAKGAYKLSLKLPKENLVLRIPLSTGGALEAFLVTGGPGQLDVDTASSIGARYVLDRFVQGKVEILAKLPGTEADALTRAVDGGLALATVLKPSPRYLAAELTQAADDLRAKVPAVDQQIEKIKALLLGQTHLGSGKPALEVPLPNPGALAFLPGGELVIAENGRLRRLNKDGTLDVLADATTAPYKRSFPRILNTLVAADGTIFLNTTQQVLKLAPDGTTTTLLGPGAAGPGPVAGSTAAETHTESLVLDPDGTLYVAFSLPTGTHGVLAIAPNSPPKDLGLPAAFATTLIRGLGRAPDGGFDLILIQREVGLAQLYHWKPGSQPVDRKLTFPGLRLPEVLNAPDGTLYVVDRDESELVAVAPDGTRRPVIGPNAPAPANGFSTHVRPALDAAGTLYVADASANLVRALGKDGTWRTVAGFSGLAQTGSKSEIAVSGPGGLAWDEQGRLLVAESGSCLVKRFDGDTYATLAGSLTGYAGDKGPALMARFGQLTGLAVVGPKFYLGDRSHGAIRVVDAAGVVDTAVGSADITVAAEVKPAESATPSKHNVGAVVGVVVGPDGSVYWTSSNRRQVQRLTPDGLHVVLTAGAPGAPVKVSGPLALGHGAQDISFLAPGGLAFDGVGRLCVSDTLAGVVYRIKDPAGTAPTIEAVIGKGLSAAANGQSSGLDAEGVAGDQANLYLPGGLSADAAGNLYVTELGTRYLTGVDVPGIDSATIAADSGLPDVPPRVRRIGADNTLHTVAGPGSTYLADPAAEGALIAPTGVAIAPDGRLAIADTGASLIHILPKGSF
ncbi:MAG: repeat containing protein [Cyanobacteria bacterium RYN_339]|nr:repeat containing protein [Cyanobacteria bacterium RYN_339]